MEPFLKEVVRRILKEHPSDLDRVAVVFNNRRPGLFVRKYLKGLAPKPYFEPKLMGMDDLLSLLGNLEIVPNEFLLFELYDIYRNHCGSEEIKTFDKFIPVADMMLKDFAEVDRYRVDARDIFSNVGALKSMDYWDVSSPTPEESIKSSHLKLYKDLHFYYTELRGRLIKQHKAYSGMAARCVAENIESMMDPVDFDHVYFVGFNALSTCELDIMKAFVRQGRGSFIADGDAYYYNPADDASKIQEAGHFLAKYKDAFPTIGEYPNHFNIGKKTINIVSCANNVIQAKYAGQLVGNIGASPSALQDGGEDEESPLQNTALVLSDEGLLFSVLNSLPDSVDKANISMGYPFASTAMHSVALKVLSFYSNSKLKHTDDGSDVSIYYHRDLLDLLGDLYVSKLLSGSDVRTKLAAKLREGNVIFADWDTLSSIGGDVGIACSGLEFLFKISDTSVVSILEQLKVLVLKLMRDEILGGNSREMAACADLLEIVDCIISLQVQYSYIENLSSLIKIYRRIAQRRTISFFGKPLQGLQILGVLETRNLDFKHVVLVSANEGVFPAGRNESSFIPHMLKAAYGMSTYQDKDAVYAFNFYHLLQRAEDITILYNTDDSGLGKGIESRFVQQIRSELPARCANVVINEQVAVVNNDTQQVGRLFEVKKTPDIISKLKNKNYSPSSLNIYRSCPLKFYYSCVLGAKEEDELTDEVGSNLFGTIVHGYLEEVYKPFIGKRVDVESLKLAKENAATRIPELFAEEFVNGIMEEGKNKLLQKVAIEQVERFLQKEMELCEKNYVQIVEIEPDDEAQTVDIGAFSVSVKGRTDRIDMVGDTLRVVDYKTGKVDPLDLKFTSTKNDYSDKSFQVLFYAWYYRKMHPGVGGIMSGIYPLQDLSNSFLPVIIDNELVLTDKVLDDFEARLESVFTELWDSELPFSTNNKNGSCRYCPIRDICSDANFFELSK